MTISRGLEWVLSPLGLIFLILLASLLPQAIYAQNPGQSPAEVSEPTDNDQHGQLHLVSWEAQILGRIQPGTACWIAGPHGALRLEILSAGDPAALENLLRQEGEGYSLILGSGEAGTFNSWHRQWRKVDSASASWVRLVSGILSGQDSSELVRSDGLRLLTSLTQRRVGRLPCHGRSQSKTKIRVQLPVLRDLSADPETTSRPSVSSAKSPFRQRMSHRGQGRGGPQEILTLVATDFIGQPGWQLTSSRKPGRILISSPQTWSITSPGVEVFAPLWPLAELVEIVKKNPGTSR